MNPVHPQRTVSTSPAQSASHVIRMRVCHAVVPISCTCTSNHGKEGCDTLTPPPPPPIASNACLHEDIGRGARYSICFDRKHVELRSISCFTKIAPWQAIYHQLVKEREREREIETERRKTGDRLAKQGPVVLTGACTCSVSPGASELVFIL